MLIQTLMVLRRSRRRSLTLQGVMFGIGLFSISPEVYSQNPASENLGSAFTLEQIRSQTPPKSSSAEHADADLSLDIKAVGASEPVPAFRYRFCPTP